MSSFRFIRCGLASLVVCGLLASAASGKWKYFRAGALEDSSAKPRAGYALMGGGTQQSLAFTFLCQRTNGGDFLILRANTEDDYAKKVNEEIRAVCPLNSAATIVFSDREDSADSKVVQIIEQAESIFVAGGDQSTYIRFWQDTPVQDALNRHIAAGKPIGGSSAGLAILGEFSFAAMIDTVYSSEALGDPYGNKITLSRNFLRIPLFAGVITDTHFAKRDRMGRLVVFLARVLQDGWAKHVRSIAVEENTAVLVEPDGQAKIVGLGSAYFIEAKNPPSVCRKSVPLQMTGIWVHRTPSGATFDVKTWTGAGDEYALVAGGGELKTEASTHGVY